MKNSKKLFLIDGMALIYRAFYALIKNPLKDSKGLNTSAIYGFINSLIKLSKDEKPDYIAIILDTKAKTFRHKEYNLYKANRKPMPEELSEQIEPLLKILENFNIKIYKKDGYEADDIIGTIIEKFKSNEKLSIFMYSSDKDLMQLIDKSVMLYSPGNSFKPTKIYKTNDVLEKWGVNVEQFVDFLSLLGDSSDNIPGVKGVGQKTASKLITKFGTLENIYKSIDNIENERLKKILINNKKEAFLSKDLITIRRNVDINFTLSEMDSERLKLSSMINSLHEYDIYTFDKLLFNQKEVVVGGKSIKKKYNIIDTVNKFNNFTKEILKQEFVSVDLETTDLNAIDAELVGISFSFKKNSGYYLPFNYPGKDEEALSFNFLIETIKPILENKKIKYIGQNIKYDALVLKKYNINLYNIYFDTMIAESLISPEKNSYKLDNLSLAYLNYKMIPISDLIIVGEYDTMLDVPLEKIAYYACEDADVAFQIFNIQKNILDEMNLEKLFYEVEMPLVEVLIDIENNGVYVDNEIISELCLRIKNEIKIISEKIYSISGYEFNINSPKQLAEVLFDKLMLKMFKKRSTSVDVLKKLLDYHPIAQQVLDYRHLSKLVNTYLEKIPNYINNKSKRIHTSFNQSITSTGRLSSTKPNFQNIPIKTDIGKSIRKAFKAQNKNDIILSFDYSQIELRILAHYSKEEKLINAFKNNIDVHTKTASLIYGINNEDVKYNHRRVAKIINYSIAYGAGPFRISEELKISIKQASTIIDNYFERYPGIKNYIEQITTYGEKNGFVQTKLGRRRNTINLNSTNRNIREAEKRATINMPIQGTASELIKVAMIAIYKKIQDLNLKGKMILQVHDELLFEIPEEEKDIMIRLVKNEMENAIQLDVPVLVDYNCGNNWYEAH